MDQSKNKRRSGKRPKKCKFKENQYVKMNSEGSRKSASGKKLNSILPVFDDTNFVSCTFIDKSIVLQTIMDCVSCKFHGGDITIK